MVARNLIKKVRNETIMLMREGISKIKVEVIDEQINSKEEKKAVDQIQAIKAALNLGKIAIKKIPNQEVRTMPSKSAPENSQDNS